MNEVEKLEAKIKKLKAEIEFLEKAETIAIVIVLLLLACWVIIYGYNVFVGAIQ